MSTVRDSELHDRDAALLGAVSLVQRVRDAPRPTYLSVVIGLSALTLGLGVGALVLTGDTSAAALWWPASGTSALLYLFYRGPRWHVFAIVAVVSAIANLAIGRPLVLVFWGSVILVIELVVFAWVIGPPGRSALLGSSRGLARFFAACAAASVALSILGGASFFLLVGIDPIAIFLALLPSHLSALLLIVPVALVPLPRERRGRTLELAAQVGLTTVVILIIFSPVQSAQVGALLFPFFGWAAVRFHPMVATAELVLLATLAWVLTVLGGGPYASTGGAPTDIFLFHVNLLSLALTIQFIAVVRSERAVVRAENDRRATLLHEGLAVAHIGAIFVRPDPELGVSIIEINDVAASLVDDSWFKDLSRAWLESDTDNLSTQVTLDDGRTIQVHGNRAVTDDGDSILAIQLVDISSFMVTQQAMEQAVEHERRVVEHLHELSQRKDEFIAAVSHELRTPITSIVGFAEDLNETATAEQRVASEIILRNAVRLTEMVEDLLELGRMTTPNPVRQASSIDLSVIARDVCNDHLVAARTREVSLSTTFSSHPALVLSHANSLSRIATNLVSNAIKFTPDGGTVQVSTVVGADTVTLIVDDSGPGISDVDEPRVFERFFRSSDPERRQTPGTGLGLSIVKSLVELLQGRVDIDRSPLGGARLSVTLPRSFEPVVSA